jgi:methionyl-tRNA synthetase
MPRRVLVTSALPYANGPIHLGYMLEAIQTDIWVRFRRMLGHECVYVCADDTHGTPIMLKAKAEGVTPEELIERVWREHKGDLQDFGIGIDNFYTTHSEENRMLTVRLYEALDRAGHILRRTIRQLYDEQAGIFLPDRYVRGTCPVCGTPDQYGDSCENCGSTYSPRDLKDPISVVSGTRPIERESEHLFFRLSAFEPMLRAWTRSGALQPSVINKLDEWFAAGLQEWDISRDAPYFGFEIPNAPGKYFYVWLDAPVGYMASFYDLCRRRGWQFEEWWSADSSAELHHFIGKDILYFHSLFWPAVLHGAGLRKPTGVHVHGFLTINGEKMSKSRGTFITARQYLEHLSPEYLRYYFAGKLNPNVEDIDFNSADFIARINGELVGKYVNIASRAAQFISRHFENRLSSLEFTHANHWKAESYGVATADGDGSFDWLASWKRQAGLVGALYESREFAKAVRVCMEVADSVNQYFDFGKPWARIREEIELERARAHFVCSVALEGFRILTLLLKPVLPDLARRAEEFLKVPPLRWDHIENSLAAGHAIGPYTYLLTRVEAKRLEALFPVRKDVANVSTVTAADAGGGASDRGASDRGASDSAPPAPISIEEFRRLDLRVARIAKAEHVEGADKLLRLTLDLGTETRTVFAGIKSAYDPAQLTGRLTVMVANLAPRKMKFGVSQGMVLAASGDGPGVYLLSPDSGAAPGMRVS